MDFLIILKLSFTIINSRFILGLNLNIKFINLTDLINKFYFNHYWE
jgi:hypothetical protein